MANCGTCGTPMVHFKNPDRDECPKENEHASARQGGTRGMKPGQQAGGRQTNPSSANQRRIREQEARAAAKEAERLKNQEERRRGRGK